MFGDFLVEVGCDGVGLCSGYFFGFVGEVVVG